MDKNLNVARAPKDATFQVRINSEIKKTVEEIYARTGMTLTDAFNTFIQQSINVEGLPFSSSPQVPSSWNINQVIAEISNKKTIIGIKIINNFLTILFPIFFNICFA